MSTWGQFNYWAVVVLMMTGLYVVIANGNLVKKVLGLNLFQAAVFVLYISLGKLAGGPRRSLPSRICTTPIRYHTSSS